LCSCCNVGVWEKAPRFRIREIFSYHWRGYPYSLNRDKDRSPHPVAFVVPRATACSAIQARAKDLYRDWHQPLGVSRRLRVGLGLANLRCCRFCFVPCEKALDHVKRDRN
jgi:hypothetical protein